MMTASNRPLDGLRVLDLSQGIPGQFCSGLLSRLGATVTLFDSGDGTRSSSFAYVNSGKLVEAVDLASFSDRDLLRRRLAGDPPNLVVEDRPPSEARRLGISPQELLAAAPSIAVVSVNNFGSAGPYSDYAASHLTTMALSGLMHQLGEQDKPPLVPAEDLGYYVAGLAAATCVTAFMTSGGIQGKHLEVPVVHAINWMQPAPLAQLAILGKLPWPRASNALPGIVQCRDASIGINLLTNIHWSSLCAMIGRPELSLREDLLNRSVRDRCRDEWMPFVLEWAERRMSADAIVEAQAAGIPASPVPELLDLLQGETHAQRGFFEPMDDDGVFIPTMPFRASPSRSDKASTHDVEEPTDRPLSGIRVLEIGAWWSLASAGAFLAGLGAEVIKIESIDRIDPWRLSYADHGSERPWETGSLFNTFNLDKKGVTLDLTRSEGTELLHGLIAESDVFLHNLSPRVTKKLRLGCDDVCKHNPALVYVSISGFGSDTAWCDYASMGLSFEQASGFALLNGYRGGPPQCLHAASDAIAGIWSALAVTVGLCTRESTRRGNCLDVSAVEGLTTFLGKAIMEAQSRGLQPERMGNESLTNIPQNVYRCRGEDSWIAISVTSDKEWRMLRRALGDPPSLQNTELLTVDGRKRRRREIDDYLTIWARGLDAEEAMLIMQNADVPSGVVISPEQQARDINFRMTEHFQLIDRPWTGPVLYPRLPLRINGETLSHRAPAPLVGQHNYDVLEGLLGLTTTECDDLVASKIIGEMPVGYT